MADPRIWARACFVAGNALGDLVMGALFIGAETRWRPGELTPRHRRQAPHFLIRC